MHLQRGSNPKYTVKIPLIFRLSLAFLVLSFTFYSFFSVSPVSAKDSANDIVDPDNKDNDDSDLIEDLKVFTDVLAIVRKDYVQPVPSKKLVEGAVKGMLAALDPHSGYLDKDFFKDLQAQTKGEFGGLGIEITIKDGSLVVVSPMEGSPAEKSGIKPGDVIVKIAGEFTKQFSLVDAVKKLRGPQGSSVVVSVMRKGIADLIEVPITREIINVRSVKKRYFGDGFGYIRISQFVEKTEEELKLALQSLKDQSPDGKISGLVLDVRNNPGGLLTQAVKVGDLFLNEGVIVYTDGRVESQKQKFYAKERGTEPGYPMVVVVNGGSASASEIVAGALKDHGRALVLGTQTFGKGSVQTITQLENGGALTLTTALYYTKSGHSLQALGVKPDVEVNDEADDIDPALIAEEAIRKERRDYIREEDLPGAIRNPSENLLKKKKLEEDINKILEKEGGKKIKPRVDINIEKDDLQSILDRDGQLRKSLDILRNYNKPIA